MPIKSVFHEEEESAQFKELFVVIMALDSTPEPFGLFPDSLYVVSLLPNLVEAHVELDTNPISPLMTFLRVSHINCLRNDLSGFRL